MGKNPKYWLVWPLTIKTVLSVEYLKRDWFEKALKDAMNPNGWWADLVNVFGLKLEDEEFTYNYDDASKLVPHELNDNQSVLVNNLKKQISK